MHSDNEQEDDGINRRDIDFKIERFLEQSQLYLNRLPILKRQLNEINRLHQFDLYVQKLSEFFGFNKNFSSTISILPSRAKLLKKTSSITSEKHEIGKIVQNLVQNIRNIEQLNSQLNEKDRLKVDRQICLLRTESDREMSEFHTLRDQAMASSIDENLSSIDDTINNNNNNTEQDETSNELRQRHATATNRLNDSYDILEQDLILLRETIGEVAQLVAQQREKVSNTEHLIHMAHDRIRNASTLLQRAVQNKYITLASGALLGASLGGPVGFVMGLKIGALAALSGSAVGALSANIMQQRIRRNDESKDNNDSYNQAML